MLYCFLLLLILCSLISCQQTTTQGNIISGLDSFGTILVQDSICGTIVNVTITGATKFTSKGSELDKGYYAVVLGSGSCTSASNQASYVTLTRVPPTTTNTSNTKLMLSGSVSNGLTEVGSFILKSKQCGTSTTVSLDGNTLLISEGQALNTGFFIGGLFEGTCAQAHALNITLSSSPIDNQFGASFEDFDAINSHQSNSTVSGHKQFAWYFICIITVACTIALASVAVVAIWFIRTKSLTSDTNYKELDSRSSSRNPRQSAAHILIHNKV